jgi:spore coat polysaccharide biosynthesis protein SpsF
MQDKIVVVVQARMTSSRLPGKVLMPVLGKSLLMQMVERIKRTTYPVTVVVATSTDKSDDVIEEEAKQNDIECYRGSLDNLLDRHYQAAKLFNAGLVIKIPSDCPLIDAKVIDKTIDVYYKHGRIYDYVSNLHPATYPDGNDVEIMTMDCLTRAKEMAQHSWELEHTTPVIWEHPEHFKIGNHIWQTGFDCSMTHRFTIDYIEDYHFILKVFEMLYPAKPHFSCNDILQLLEEHPEIYKLNEKYIGVNWYRNHLSDLKTVSAGQTKLI